MSQLKNYVAERKSYSILPHLRSGYWIDIREDTGEWRVARVLSVQKETNNKFYVITRMDGWSSKYTDKIKLPSDAIAPLHKHTPPYTGLTKRTQRDELILTVQMLLSHRDRLQKIARYEEPLDCEYLNQYVRGDLYVFIDTILSQPVRLKEKQYKEFMNFLQTYIRLAIQIIKNGLNFLPQLTDYLKDLSYFIVHPKLAYLLCTIQLMDSLANLIKTSTNSFRLKFHTFHQNISEREDVIIKKLKTFMIESGLIDVSNQLLNAKIGDRTLPWCLRKGALLMLHLLGNNPDLPEFDIRDANDIFQLFPYFSELYQPDIVETRQINLIFELIYSTSFERKLKGLNELKNLLDRTSMRYRTQKLVNVMKEKGIIDYLTDNNNFNSELFRRSTPIFQFAIKQKSFKNQHLDRIVRYIFNQSSLSRSRHQSDLRLIYTTLAQLAKHLPTASLDYLYSKIIELQVDDLLLVLLREFTTNALCNMNSSFSVYNKRKNVGSQKYGLFGLAQLWTYCQDEAHLSSELSLLAVNEFVQLILSEYCRPEKEKYILLCLKQVQKGVSFGQSLKVIQLIVKDYHMGTVAEILVRADKDYSIVETSTQTLTKLISKQLPLGKLTLEQCIENYFNFLEEVNPILRKSLSSAHVKTFWRMANKDHLLSFLRKTRYLPGEKDQKANKFYEKRIDNNFIKELMDNVFLVPELMNNYCKMDYSVYMTVDQLFMSYHIRSKNIDFNHKNTIRINRQDMIDHTFYYRVLMAENSQKVTEAAIRRLVELNIRPMAKASNSAEVTNKVTMWSAFTQKIFKELSKQPHILLKVFKYFLQSIQGRRKSINILSTLPTTLVVKLLEPEQTKSITLPCCSSLYKLRLKIGEEFDIKGTDFEIYLKQNNFATTFSQEEDFSLAVIQINPETPNSPSILIRPSKEQHPHSKALQKFHDMLAQSRIEVLYQMLDQLRREDLALMFDILFKLPKLKSLENKLLKLELTQNNWNSILSSSSMRKLYYQLDILQVNKNPKWVMNFIAKKGVEHMISILVKVESHSLGQDFNLKCCSLLIYLLSQYIKFLTNASPSTLEQIFQELVTLMDAAVHHSSSLTMDFLINCFRLLNSLISLNPAFIAMFYRHKTAKTTLQYALFTENSKELSQIFLEGLKKDIDTLAVRQAVVDVLVAGFLNAIFLDKYRQTCDTYFTIINRILEQSPKTDWAVSSGLVIFVSNFLMSARKLAYQEKSSADYDGLLNGLLTITSLVHRKTGMPVQSIMKEKELSLAEWLLHDCLFPPLDKSQSAKCKSARNRAEAFAILNLLPTSKQFCLQEISKLFVPILSKSAWRKPGEWAITVSSEIPREFRGLKNMGATCYINSLMQQLYHIKEFREQLLKIEPGEEACNILLEVQKIFAYLKNSESSSYTPKSFCTSFKVDGHAIDPRMQMDADEFFNNIMDKLDNQLKLTKQQHIITNVFQGEISNQLICEGCPHFSERYEDFLALGVTIKNKTSLEQALKEFIKGEVLDGDNAYYCEKCEKKVRCLKRACIKELPNMLMIVLKRFEFDYDSMEKIKLNDYCEFPLNLDMKPYTKEFLKNDSQPGETVFRDDSYYQYSLKGTVVHHGTSEAGHYYSYIRIADDKWYEFNDEWIEKFDLADLKDETFGGAEESQYIEGQKKAKNAYILFYQRKNNFIGGEQTTNMVSPIPQPSSYKALQAVEEDNLKNQYVRVAFDSNLTKYLLSNIGVSEGKLAMLYYHLVLMRSRERSNYLLDYYNLVERLIKKDNQLAEWYISQIGEPFLRQFLFDAVKEVKYAVLSMIGLGLKNGKINPQFIKRCMACLSRRGMTPFAKVFYLMGSTSKQYVKLLKEHDYPNRVLKIIDSQQSTTKQPSRPFASQFGESANWQQPIKQQLCFNTLLHSLEPFDIKYEEIKKYTSNRMKHARISIAKIIARAVKGKEYFERMFQQVLLNDITKCEDQKDLMLNMRIIRELIEMKDQYAEERMKRLADIHISAMKELINSYQYFTILLDNLIRFCSKNLLYRSKVIVFLSDNKYQVFKQFKNWILDSTSPLSLINTGRLQMWKKSMTPIQSKNLNNIMANMQGKEVYFSKRKEARQEKFLKLIDKEEFEVDESPEELQWPKGAKYQYTSLMGRLISFEVIEKAGLLYIIKIQGNQRWQNADEDIN